MPKELKYLRLSASQIDTFNTCGIKGFDHYFVSREGRVYSGRSGALKSLAPCPDKDGYLNLALRRGHKPKYFKVHRLVAQAFIPNPENKPTVNHKNGLKDDNRVENLEWATHSENHRHAFRELGRKPSYSALGMLGVDSPNHKVVEQYTLSGDFVCTHPSAKSAQDATGVCRSGIGRCCLNKVRTAGGFKWSFATEG